MERRKRVELIMNSRLFREELERIIESQIKAGNSSAGLLQQISDMVGSKYSSVNNHFGSKCVNYPNTYTTIYEYLEIHGRGTRLD